MNPQNLRKEKAQGMVEFALVLPLLLLVMFAIIEFGRLLFVYSAVFTASRDAVRYGAASGSPGNYQPYYQDCAGMRAAARRFGSLVGIQDANINISYDDGSGGSLGVCPTGATNVSLGDRVIVQVTAQYQPILPLVRIPAFPISSRAARTVLKDISISGTPSAPTGSVTVFFASPDSTWEESAGEVTVRVRLSALFAEDIWIPFSVTGGTATIGTDYTVDTTSPVLMRSGATQVDIHITINQDTLDEDDQETVILTLGDPSNANLSAPEVHTLNITDDDDPPSVSFTTSGQDIPEPADGSSLTVYVTAQLSTVSGRNVSVPFSADPANTTAAVGADYVFDTTNPLVIPAGALNNRIEVRVIGDVTDEEDETVRVAMGTPVNATPGLITEHTVGITDDDLPPFVSFTWDWQEVAEDVGNVGIQVQLSAVSGKVISVPYSLAGSATQGQDYSIQASPLVITPGLTTTNIPVDIYLDSLEEPDETITVTLSTPSNAFLGTPSVHTMLVRSEIEPPTVFFIPIYQEFPEAGGETVTVLAQLSRAYYQDISVPFIIEGTAQLGVDYQITASPVVIRAGSASAAIEITIVNDMIDEIDEVIQLTMIEPPNATLGHPYVHETLIQDDDDAPLVYFATPGQSGNEDVGVMPVTVRLSNIAGVDVMVPFTVGGSATQGSDYTLSPTTMVTIPAGYLDRTININVVNDDSQGGAFIGEPDESIILTMDTLGIINATPGAITTHTATIRAWTCPTAAPVPYFESGDSKRLNWQFAFTDLRTLNLAQVTISWPTHGGTKLEAINFGTAIWSGSENSGNLTVNTPSPLWSGSFATRQMVFLFSKSPELQYGNIGLTARFEHCPVLSASISN
jgi:hypothetical protein